jgi:hypothetical protein
MSGRKKMPKTQTTTSNDSGGRPVRRTSAARRELSAREHGPAYVDPVSFSRPMLDDRNVVGDNRNAWNAVTGGVRLAG